MFGVEIQICIYKLYIPLISMIDRIILIAIIKSIDRLMIFELACQTIRCQISLE